MKKLVGLTIIVAFLPAILFADLINITIPDINDEYGSTYSWYKDVKNGYVTDDNEVEYNCVPDQNWDLEGFFLDNSNNELSMVGGYNFEIGYGGFDPGDIFIDVDGGSYDYALVLDFGTSTYDVYSIDGTASLEKVYFGQNNASNPWKYTSGGEAVTEDIAFSYDDFETASGENIYDVKGDSNDDGHYVVSGIDLSFLGTTDFMVHYTMECGNDNLMGRGSISVPEPGTLSLLTMGSLCLIGFWALRRKKEDD